jgi:hypothetical protein
LIKLDKFELKRYHLYQEFSWSISSAPLWVVRGINLDAIKSGKKYSGNRAGKSMLFNALIGLWLAQPPFSTKKNSAKEIVPQKGSATLYGSSGKNKFVITQKYDKKLDYQIKINGKAQKVMKIDDQRKTIQKLLKLNSDHIYSFLYIHSFRPSVLQIGSSSARYDYIESIFNLRIYDVINKKLLRIANQQKIARMQLPKLVSQKKEIKASPKEQQELALKLESISSKLQDKVHKLDKIGATLQKYNSLVTLFSSLKSEKSSETLKKELKNIRIETTRIETDLEEMQIAWGKQIAAEEAKFKRFKLEREKTALKRILKKSGNFTEADQENLYEQSYKTLLLLEEYPIHETDILAWRHLDRNSIISKAEALLEPYEKIHNLEEKINEAISVISSNLFSSNSTIAEFTQLQKKQKCPTCYQILSSSTVDRLIAEAKTEKTKYLQQLEVLENYSRIQRVNQLDKRFRESSIEELHSEYTDAKQLLVHVEEHLHTKGELQRVQRQLNDLPKNNSVPVSKEALLSNKKKLAQLTKQAEFITSELAVHQRLDRQYTKTEREQIRERYKALKETHSELSKSIMPLNETVQRLSVAVSTGKIDLNNYTRLKAEIQQIEQETEDYKLMQDLVEIYSPKGVRIQHIQTLVSNYINLCNQYASSIFAEPIKFSSNLKKSNFSIVAERSGGIADVNSFSGSESRQFSALSALVLRILMPKELQPNIIALDEVEAGMSEIDRNYFFQHFIPLLQQFVPIVIILTPHDEKVVSLPTASTVLLTRKDNKTTAKIKVNAQ